MACPTCGERCTCVPERGATIGATLLDPQPASGRSERELAQPSLYTQDEMWRQEVASRVDAFCARRGRKRVPRPSSLSLDFERAVRATVAAHYAIPEPQVDPAPAPAPEPEASNLIEFPRPAEPSYLPEPMPYIEELAEPMIDKPRILDAEEPSGLMFGGEGRPAITLESAPEPEAGDDAGPVGESASLARRICAATLDGLLVATAIACFASTFLHMAGVLPRSRTAWLLAGALPVLLWATYQYLFLVHAAATPGMRAAGLRVRTFDDQPARRSLRRWRAIAMVVSGMALGLGFLWASVDEYGLCWHDRITHTVLRRG
jgi:uncharacterized RDD family membrane protein YckC